MRKKTPKEVGRRQDNIRNGVVLGAGGMCKRDYIASSEVVKIRLNCRGSAGKWKERLRSAATI